VRVVLIDAFNVGHVAFHGMGDLDYHGRQTGVIFGFLNKILQLAQRYETGRFIFAWDSQQRLRQQLYPEYKQSTGRVKVIRGEDEVNDYKALHDQMARLYEQVLPQLGFVNVLKWIGLEADDVIAAVIKYGTVHPNYWLPQPNDWADIQWIIVSGDKDMYQLLAPDVQIYSTGTKEDFTLEDFRARYGIEPSQWVEAKAMGGCDSDNVAGIAGIADPAKSVKSRALKIVRGEITRGAYVDKVNSPLGQLVIERNRALIELPYEHGRKWHAPHILPDMLDRTQFMMLFDELGFNSFLTPKRWALWEEYFDLEKNKEMAGGAQPV
jgi:hypothetical protein